jgi:hypothetical protein
MSCVKFTLGFTLLEERRLVNAAKGLGLPFVCDWNHEVPANKLANYLIHPNSAIISAFDVG